MVKSSDVTVVESEEDEEENVGSEVEVSKFVDVGVIVMIGVSDSLNV